MPAKVTTFVLFTVSSAYLAKSDLRTPGAVPPNSVSDNPKDEIEDTYVNDVASVGGSLSPLPTGFIKNAVDARDLAVAAPFNQLATAP